MKTTREMIREIVSSEPHLNQSEIAARVGVSRERVRQIVSEEEFAVPRGIRGVMPRQGRASRIPQSRVRTGGVVMPINHTTAGTISELLAAADLTARWYVVFFPLVRTAICDLVVIGLQGSVERIEVRSGHRYDGRVVWSRPDASKSDRRAIVLSGEPVHYDPPLE